jgi:hypothetical protein
MSVGAEAVFVVVKKTPETAAQSVPRPASHRRARQKEPVHGHAPDESDAHTPPFATGQRRPVHCRRQGGEPGRDAPGQPAGARGLCGADRGVSLLRRAQRLPGVGARAGRGCAGRRPGAARGRRAGAEGALHRGLDPARGNGFHRRGLCGGRRRPGASCWTRALELVAQGRAGRGRGRDHVPALRRPAGLRG